MWKDDCVIDDIELDASSLEVPRLHAKYTELLSEKKLEVVRYERKMKELNKDKHQLLSILKDGTEKAKVIADKNLKEIKEIVGFI